MLLHHTGELVECFDEEGHLGAVVVIAVQVFLDVFATIQRAVADVVQDLSSRHGCRGHKLGELGSEQA